VKVLLLAAAGLQGCGEAADELLPAWAVGSWLHGYESGMQVGDFLVIEADGRFTHSGSSCTGGWQATGRVSVEADVLTFEGLVGYPVKVTPR
jgi:hypothetical protein